MPKYVVAVHETCGSIGEAIDPQWSTVVDGEDAAKKVYGQLREAIGDDPDTWVRDSVTVTYWPLGPAGEPSEDADAARTLWRTIREQSCCLQP